MEFKKLIPARTKQNNQKKKTVLKILDFFYSIFVGKKYDIKNVRRVYFGLSIRMTFLISIILIIILFITGTTFFLFQRQALFNEKNNKAASLTRILSDQAEYYLDKDINTSSLDRKNKLIYIKENSETFKKFNEDIIKIVLVNEKGTIEYSTYAPDIGRITNGSYLFKCLKERELQRYDFKENKKKYRAVAYPVFLSKGIILEVTTDFKKYYTKYHASKLNEKKKIYNALWKKYNTYLDNSLAPNATPIYAIQKNDIDFLFHSLFTHLLKERMKSAKPKESYLWNEKWIVTEKNKIISAYQNNLPKSAVESLELIQSRIIYMSEQINDIKLLGGIAILFDLTMIAQEINKNIKVFTIISLIIALLSLIIFYIIIRHLVKNIKTLEEGALQFGLGNLENRIFITTNDETGRLSDILNNMAKDIKEKIHMEKFISKSTQSMIKQSNSKGLDVTPGAISRVELSFIFADVRGFTAFSESHTPEEVIKTLNVYFEIQHKIVQKNKGDIDDYVGDQIMAHFGGLNHKSRACKASLEIKKSIDLYNEKRKKQNLDVFDVGIGVHSGVVVVGNIGADVRMDFACVGDAVNTTSRLCSNAKAGEILVSESHIADFTTQYKLSQPVMIEAKGKKNKIKAFILMG
ncbi:MAG: hypothetical protein A2015_05555 [Spirochaetes bacterium GWF1_31_7]|nr:MAG: hypothetical protein A2Y30_04655 [Spirochaetes bacterium GWE1_32_154]OHD52557.1 MAG: hypothetical protein A2015_05555 [Spirochaetes bacterium GWF1_31_7]OHD80641.1 MAG: hypothetical protein A2355_02490 [Spirochaetes bacterium RIFOXYB1_FULL_32_8]HBD93433.1 hypothetical protein [Spirochaetia bacterium]HBI36259.1 hypothetical protein [Spirochaetia bacterium]